MAVGKGRENVERVFGFGDQETGCGHGKTRNMEIALISTSFTGDTIYCSPPRNSKTVIK
jgi:hypothetical protein